MFEKARGEEHRNRYHLRGGLPLCDFGDLQRPCGLAKKFPQARNKYLSEEDNRRGQQYPFMLEETKAVNTAIAITTIALSAIGSIIAPNFDSCFQSRAR